MAETADDTLREQHREHRELIRRKVDFPVFAWVVGILASSMVVISGYLFTSIASERTARAEMAAKFEAEREKNTAVLISLEQIKGDMRLMRDQLERAARVR
jgi:hypothetical protein